MRILLLGSSGMLGKYIFQELKKNHLLFHNGINKKKNSLSKINKLKKLLITSRPDVVINAAGFTNIDLCEKNKKKSKIINVKIIENIFNLKKKLNQQFSFIQISTDQIYDFKNKYKAKEIDKPKINNEYSKQKYLAEKVCKKNKSIILRVNFFGLSMVKKESFSDWIIKSFKKKKPFYLVDDVFFSPLRMFTIAKIISKILRTEHLKRYGIFNLGSKDGISKKSFALRFADLLNIDNKLYQTKKINNICSTKRSKNMMMNVLKFEKTFKIVLPKVYKEIKEEILSYEKN